MQQNASGGQYINEMGVQGIVVKIRRLVVKYPDAWWLEIEHFCPCSDRSAGRLLQARPRGSNYLS